MTFKSLYISTKSRADLAKRSLPHFRVHSELQRRLIGGFAPSESEHLSSLTWSGFSSQWRDSWPHQTFRCWYNAGRNYNLYSLTIPPFAICRCSGECYRALFSSVALAACSSRQVVHRLLSRKSDRWKGRKIIKSSREIHVENRLENFSDADTFLVFQNTTRNRERGLTKATIIN